jgi:hypothetical protein
MATGLKMTLTNDELSTLRQACQSYINRHPENSPFHYALTRTLKQTKAAFEDYADGENEIRIDSSLVDSTTGKFVLMDDKNPAIDPKKAKELQKRTRDLSRKEVEVEIYQATSIPPTLESVWYQQFEGIIFKEQTEVKNGKKSEKMAVAE